jgi:hypothetical protein
MVGAEPVNQLFTTYVAPNGTSGNQVGSAQTVAFPAPLTQADITYLFTYKGLVYITFAQAVVLTVQPSTGAMLNSTNLLPSSASGLVDSLACDFDAATGTFWANAVGSAPSGTGHFLHSFNVLTGASTVVGPLGPTPTTGSNPGGLRADDAEATMAVYPPASVGGGLRLLEVRTSLLEPFFFMAWLDPVSGNSSLVPLPEDFYKMYDLDPEIYPDQWPGSKRRVWAYDPVDNVAWLKMYDECDQADDCTEDETLVSMEWVPPAYTDMYVAVEPIEPELTQLSWVWTNKEQ